MSDPLLVQSHFLIDGESEMHRDDSSQSSDDYKDSFYTEKDTSSSQRNKIAPIKFTISSQKKESAVDSSATEAWL